MDAPKIGSKWTHLATVWVVESIDKNNVILHDDRNPDRRSRVLRTQWPGEARPVWPPMLGSKWDWAPYEELKPPIGRDPDLLHRVVKVAGGTVTLVENQTGSVYTESAKTWPGPFLPHFDLLTSWQNRLLNAALVGGAPGEPFARIHRIAINLSVRITSFVPMNKTLRKSFRFPEGTDLVILLISHLSHSTEAVAIKAARADGINFVRVRSAGFEPSLRERLTDLYPFRYTGAYYGRLEGPPPVPDQIWVWTGQVWELQSIGRWTEEAPAPPSAVRHQISDLSTATGLVAAGAMATWLAIRP